MGKGPGGVAAVTKNGRRCSICFYTERRTKPKVIFKGAAAEKVFSLYGTVTCTTLTAQLQDGQRVFFCWQNSKRGQSLSVTLLHSEGLNQLSDDVGALHREGILADFQSFFRIYFRICGTFAMQVGKCHPVPKYSKLI